MVKRCLLAADRCRGHKRRVRRLLSICASSFLTTSLVAAAVNAAEPASKSERDDRVELAFEGAAGPVVRLGESGFYDVTERVGLSFAAGARLSPSPLFSLGLFYEHAALGRETSGDDPIDRVDLTRDANAIWGTVFLHVVSTDSLRLAIALGPGVAWQSAFAIGSYSGDSPWRSTSFTCEGSDSADLALGAGLSATVPLDGGLSFVSDARFQSYGFGTDALGTCAAGIGTTATVGLRAGFAYGFDVARFVR